MRIHRPTIRMLGSYLKFKVNIWGTCHLYFRRQIWCSDNNFYRLIFGQSFPLNLLMWKQGLGFFLHTESILSFPSFLHAENYDFRYPLHKFCVTQNREMFGVITAHACTSIVWLVPFVFLIPQIQFSHAVKACPGNCKIT